MTLHHARSLPSHPDSLPPARRDSSGVIDLEALLRDGPSRPSAGFARPILLSSSGPRRGFAFPWSNPTSRDRLLLLVSSLSLFVAAAAILLSAHAVSVARAALATPSAATTAAPESPVTSPVQSAIPTDGTAIPVTEDSEPTPVAEPPPPVDPDPQRAERDRPPAGRRAIDRGAPAPRPATPRAAETEGATDERDSRVPESLDTLIDRAAQGSEDPLEGGGSPEGPSSTLPETPSRARVASVLRSVAPAVDRCTEGSTGTVSARIVVDGPTGRVTSANVSGNASAAESACMRRAVEGLRFPRFERSPFTVTFPYRI